MPWLVFALLFLPIYLRMIRVRLLETFDEPWITTARAKGASETARRRGACASKRDGAGPADARGRCRHGDHGGDLHRNGLRARRHRLPRRPRIQRRTRRVRPAAHRGHRRRRRHLRRAAERGSGCRRSVARSAHPDDDHDERAGPAAASSRVASARATRPQHRARRDPRRTVALAVTHKDKGGVRSRSERP